MGGKRDTYKILVGNAEGKRPLGRPRHRCEYNIKIEIMEIGWERMDWMHVDQDRDQWPFRVNTIINFRIP
jgi:hypothetical protein